MPVGNLKHASSAATQDETAHKEEDPRHSTWNPLSMGAEVQAFCDWVLKLAEHDGKTLSQEEFDRVSRSYKTFNGLQKYSIASHLARAGIAWTSMLERGDYAGYTASRG